MLRLSKKLLFAIEAVVDIAYHGGTEPARSSDICRRQGIPRRYLEQVLQQLVHHGILSGQRGPKGGYRLARERRRIFVGDIIRIVSDLEKTPESPETLSAGQGGSELALKVVHPLWREVQNEIMDRFDNTTIEQLCDLARHQDITSEARPVMPDFSI